MNLPDTPEVDDVDDGLMDMCLNAELIYDVNTGDERKGRVVKCAKETSGEPLGAHTPTHCLSPVSMWSSSRMEHLILCKCHC
jgi:hypothetical protein